MTNKVRQWLLMIMVSFFAIINLQQMVQQFSLSDGTFEYFLDNTGWLIISLVFLIVATIILFTNRNNSIGWILMGPVLTITIDGIGLWLYGPVSELPSTLKFGQSVMIWLSGWSWWLLIGPILLISLLFPDGKPHGRRWRLAPWLLGITFSFFMFFATFSSYLEDPNGEYVWPNPIGFIPDEISEGFFIVFTIMLASSAAVSLAALISRYRKSQGIERAQMKWLFYAMSLFLLVYLFLFLIPDRDFTLFINALFSFTMVLIPISIGIAIMRYRLWDIDLVINRSLLYGLLTAVIAAIWAGSLTVIDQIITNLVGDQSKAASTVLSTLLAASIVQPARNQIEIWINGRFFPEKQQIQKGFIEIEPRFWGQLDLQQIAQLSVDRVCAIMKAAKGAFMVRDTTGIFNPIAAYGIEPSAVQTWKPDEKDMKDLQKERATEWEESQDFSGYIPIFIPRVGANEVLGLLALSDRENGRGYSGDDLKALTQLGGKLGEALYNLELDRND